MDGSFSRYEFLFLMDCVRVCSFSFAAKRKENQKENHRPPVASRLLSEDSGRARTRCAQTVALLVPNLPPKAIPLLHSMDGRICLWILLYFLLSYWFSNGLRECLFFFFCCQKKNEPKRKPPSSRSVAAFFVSFGKSSNSLCSNSRSSCSESFAKSFPAPSLDGREGFFVNILIV